MYRVDGRSVPDAAKIIFAKSVRVDYREMAGDIS